jgi:hypothetical protein
VLVHLKSLLEPEWGEGLRSTIKIVKRDQIKRAQKERPQIKPTPEQRAREMVVAVKRWVTELKERKVTLMY